MNCESLREYFFFIRIIIQKPRDIDPTWTIRGRKDLCARRLIARDISCVWSNLVMVYMIFSIRPNTIQETTHPKTILWISQDWLFLRLLRFKLSSPRAERLYWPMIQPIPRESMIRQRDWKIHIFHPWGKRGTRKRLMTIMMIRTVE